jgi:hypothetical protein
MSSDRKPNVPEATTGDPEARLQSRRQSLRDIGRFAAMTAPAMLVLLDGGIASAEDKGETGDKGESDSGWQSGNYNEHTRRHSHG